MNKLPSRDDVLKFVADSPGRVGKREIARAFQVTGGERIELKAMLAEMAEEGLLARSGKRLGTPGELPKVTLLAVTGRSRDGDLLAEPTRWEEDGPPPQVTLLGATPAPGIGDRLLARIAKDAEGRPIGKIIKVIERRPASVLGVVERVLGRAQLTPVAKRDRDGASIDAALVADIADGTLVRADVERGRVRAIVEVIGPVGGEAAVSELAIHAHGIPDRFPEAVIAEADSARPATLAGREDWRAVPFVTIDPPDAKDHDDAVHAAPDPDNEGGYVVSVAIADVAHYVRRGSAMDREARLRGNSTYFPDRVVPMLPEKISNDLCSLREGEARPALCVRMWFARDGRKTRHTFHRIMMRSARRLAYAEAQAIADGIADGGDASDDDALAPQVATLWEAYALVKRGREARQPMELDLPERKIVLGRDGQVERVIVPERLDAHKLIEEFMIQANVAAAETCEAHRVPLIYRVHDAPSVQKVDALREFLATLSIRLAKGLHLKPAQFNAILAKVAGTPHAALVNEVVLRSQSQAEYTPQNLGHFGLNLKRYAHFTSPIRRYADLVVHRALIRALDLGEDGLADTEAEELGAIGEAISATERRSMVAERETVDRLIAGWLADRIGAVFSGRITGVTRAGLFVRLDDTGGDGFVPISTLSAEYMIHEEAAQALIGEASGVTFRLGDAVRVRLLEAAPVSGAMRFEVVEHDAGPNLRPSRARRGSGGGWGSARGRGGGGGGRNGRGRR